MVLETVRWEGMYLKIINTLEKSMMFEITFRIYCKIWIRLGSTKVRVACLRGAQVTG